MDRSKALQYQIPVSACASLQPFRDIGAGADLTGSLLIVQAVPAVQILRLIAELTKAYDSTATGLKSGDAHHHALHSGQRGAACKILDHVLFPFRTQKSGAC